MSPSPSGPRYHSKHPIISLPTIYSSLPLCYLPILAQDITLSTLLLVPHNINFFTPVLPSTFGTTYHSQHPIISLPTIYSISFLCYLPLWSQISLSAPYYQSPLIIQFFTPVLPSHFGPSYHSPSPTISLLTISSSSPLCYLPLLAPDITLNTLLSVSPQYTFLHPSVTFHFWPQISV